MNFSMIFSRIVSVLFWGGRAGAENPFGSMRFLASIYLDKLLLCGGTFITTDIVLTAAHCVGGSFNSIKILDHFKDEETRGDARQSMFTVNATRLFPRYQYKSVPLYDIAVIKLNRPRQEHPGIDLDYGKYAARTGLEVYVFDWLHYPDGSRKAPRLVKTNILPISNCTRQLTLGSKRKELCVRFDSPPSMDFGSPLVYMLGKHPVILGIFSWPKPDINNLPSIFTNVYPFISWICSITKF